MDRHYIIDKVVVLKDNEIYRISDMIKKTYMDDIIKNEIMKKDIYNKSILKIYFTKIQNLKKNNLDNLILIDSIREFLINNNIQIFDNNSLVIHIRSGDNYKIFGIGNENICQEIYSSINKYLEYKKDIKKIIIITALHYGHTREESLYYKNKTYCYNQDNYNANIDVLYIFINELYRKYKLPIDIVSNEDIDIDFTLLVTAKYLIVTKGGFSMLVKNLNTFYNK